MKRLCSLLLAAVLALTLWGYATSPGETGVDVTFTAMVLAPAWCVVTDTAKYYVNCFTGAVSQG